MKRKAKRDDLIGAGEQQSGKLVRRTAAKINQRRTYIAAFSAFPYIKENRLYFILTKFILVEEVFNHKSFVNKIVYIKMKLTI